MTHFTKTGAHLKGKSPPPKIVDVETLVCPAATTETKVVLHHLTHRTNTSVICRHCKVEWATLDAEIRAAAAERQAAKGTK